MDFLEITEELKATPGEYIYHIPSKQIVLCGSFNRKENVIRALGHGRLFSDKIQNFKKIRTTHRERKRNYASRCKGCGG
tara:strand:- start:1104 stop:1340 length:237 start_codon:yes stop_codon:yes gene_type:complete